MNTKKKSKTTPSKVSKGKKEEQKKIVVESDNDDNSNSNDGESDDDNDIKDDKASSVKKNEKKVEQEEDNNDNDDDDEQEEEIEQSIGQKKRQRKRKRKNATNNNDNDNDETDENNNNNDTTNTDTTTTVKVDNNNTNNNEISTVYVEGIPFTCTKEDVGKYIQSQLNTKKINYIDIRLPVWHDSGRLRGYGHIDFKSTNDSSICLSIFQDTTQNLLNGRYLKFTIAHSSSSSNENTKQQEQQQYKINSKPSCTIIINNLSYTASEDDIYTVMSKFGTILDPPTTVGIRIVRDSLSGRSKGFAYCQYTTIEYAKVAVQTYISNNYTLSINNRNCRLDYDHGRIKGSYRTGPSNQLYTKIITNNDNSTSNSTGNNK